MLVSKKGNSDTSEHNFNLAYTIPIFIVLLIILSTILTYIFLNIKYTRSANSKCNTRLNFINDIQYKKQFRKQTIEYFQTACALFFKDIRDFDSKHGILDYSTLAILETGLTRCFEALCEYMEKIVVQDLCEYDAAKSALDTVTTERRNLADTSDFKDTYIQSIWYSGKQARYFSKMIGVTNALMKRIVESAGNEEVIRLANEVIKLNNKNKGFFDAFVDVNVHYELQKEKKDLGNKNENEHTNNDTKEDANKDTNKDANETVYGDVKQIMKDFNTLEKSYIAYCTAYANLMDKIYKIE